MPDPILTPAAAPVEPVAPASAPVEPVASSQMEVDLFDGVKVTLPKEQAQKVIAARDALKAGAKTGQEYQAIQTQHADATTKLKELEAMIPGLTEAQKRNGDLTLKITELEGKAAKADANEAVLAKILEDKLAGMPESMKPLVKGTTTIEKLQTFEELANAGVFKPAGPSIRKPSNSGGISMTFAEFVSLPPAEQAKVQAMLNSGQMAPLTS